MLDNVKKGAHAVALGISRMKAAFYKVRMIGFQDVLCDDKGYHLKKSVDKEKTKEKELFGTVDFIFGSAKSLYVNTRLHVIGDTGMTVITAQARDTGTEDCGYSFVHGQITEVGTGAYLGRAWMASPRVIFAYITMSSVVNPAGWDNNFKPEREKTVYFAEYKCSGSGANPSGRVKYAKQLSEAELQKSDPSFPLVTFNALNGSFLLQPSKFIILQYCMQHAYHRRAR
ncbi:hypothetical protein LWI28_014525 [Acer negundo]|uniref:pectinesterase n=1 Tax=Acer negundo TaxID=4023 RepID=A0AAD5NRG4_ACENE|nr:hypothetical protein LWI28_014525 [Acer negundo]